VCEYVRVGDDRRSICRGGRSGGRQAVLPCLREATGSVGLRARAQGADARRREVGQAAACVLPWLREHARAVAGVLGAAAARWRGGDRRGAVGRRARRRAPEDRRSPWPSAGDRARVAARVRAQGGAGGPLGEALGPRDRRGAWVGSTNGIPGRRSCRGARERGQSVAAACRSARLALGARGRADRRAACGSSAAAAGLLAVPAGRAPRTTSLISSCAGGCESSAAATLDGPQQRFVGA
jgi:hypothetical protein